MFWESVTARKTMARESSENDGGKMHAGKGGELLSINYTVIPASSVESRQKGTR